MEIPTRFLATTAARAAHGDRVDRLAPYLLRTDPLADAVVSAFDEMPPGNGWRQVEAALARGVATAPDAHPAVRALFEAVERVPPWVDWGTLDRAGEVLLRAGYLGGLILGLQSLPYGYASPGGNKPLAMSGRLMEQAPRRLTETARFVHAVCLPGGMRRGADGFCISVRVRLVHAQVRRLLEDSGKWDAAAWGAPINQHDMVATTMLFSLVVLDGLRKLGFRVTDAEAQRYVHLWRYVGLVLGVDPELLPATEQEGLKLADLIMRTQGPPDADSRALTAALMEVGRRRAQTDAERRRVRVMDPVARAISRELLGAGVADALEIPRSRLAPLFPVLRGAISTVERVRSLSSLLDAYAVQLGTRYWEDMLERGLEGVPADFRPPSELLAT